MSKAGVVRCRAAEAEEVRLLEAIRRDAILELAAPFLGKKYASDWVISAGPDRVSRAIQANDVRVAERDKDVVGWVEVDGNRVCALYTRPSAAGCGVGSALLTHAENRVRAAGFETIVLEASANAETFYEQRGYRPVAGQPRTDVLPMFKTFAAGTNSTTPALNEPHTRYRETYLAYLAELRTSRFDLVVASRRFLELLIESDRKQAGASIGVVVPDEWPVDEESREGLPIHLENIVRDTAEERWRIRLIVEPTTRVVVGAISLKGPPRTNGSVEIGWGVVPQRRGEGIATEAARAVIEWVCSHPEVQRITATIPGYNSVSQAVAKKLGMTSTGERHHGLPLWALTPGDQDGA